MELSGNHACDVCKSLIPINVFVRKGMKFYHITCYETETLQPRINSALNEQAEKFRVDIELLRLKQAEQTGIARAAIRAECLAELKRATIQEGAVGVDKFINKVEKEGKLQATYKDTPIYNKGGIEVPIATDPIPTPAEIKSKEDWTRAAEEVCKLAKAHYGPTIPNFLAVARFMHEKMTERKLFVKWVEIEKEAEPSEEDKRRAAEFAAQLNALKPKEG